MSALPSSPSATDDTEAPLVRRRVPRAERERQMLSAAEQVFAQRGFQGTAMEDIAELVGVSKPMLYEYFGSKEGLLRACISRVREELREATAAALARVAEPRAALHAGLLVYFEYIEGHRSAWTMLLHEPVYLTGEAADETEALRQQQTDLIASRLQAGWPRVPALEAMAWAEIIVGGCERIALWRDAHPEVTPARAAELVTNFAWPGLRALAERDQPA